MRIRVFSDLHTEFAPFSPPAVDADVVVLAGDIGLKLRGLHWARQTFLDSRVLYVPGNHEYYGAALPHLTDKLRAAAMGTNVSVLNEDVVVVDGVRFLGATLWTDFCLFGADQRDRIGEIARAKMTDFARIRVGPAFSKLTPRAVWTMHMHARQWLQRLLSVTFPGPTIIITHHAPMLASMAPRCREDPLAGAYATDLHMLLDGRAGLWIHGHTHSRVDTVVCGTRILSNQRGYPGEPVEGFDDRFVIDVEVPPPNRDN